MAFAPTVDAELDDGWADGAVRAPPLGLATDALPLASAAVTEAPGVDSGVTVKALELGYKDTLLKTGEEATAVNTVHDFLNSEKVTLTSCDGKLSAVKVNTGPLRDRTSHLPSCNLEGRRETGPT